MDEPLRQSFVALSREARPQADCPEPDRIWAAAHGELDAHGLREVIHHTAACPSCAEDWRLARAVEETAKEGLASPGPRAHRPWWLAAAAAAAALIVAGLGFDAWLSTPEPARVYRGEEPSIESVLGQEALPRDNAVLRWSGPPAARYKLWVLTPDLNVLVEVEGLEKSDYHIPAERLTGLPPGAVLGWRLEATLPDGRVLESPSFAAVLE